MVTMYVCSMNGRKRKLKFLLEDLKNQITRQFEYRSQDISLHVRVFLSSERGAQTRESEALRSFALLHINDETSL
jgi:hypothetical protein